MSSLLRESKEPHQCLAALELFEKIKPEGFEEVLADALLEKSRTRPFYERVAKLLRGSSNPHVIAAVDKVLTEVDYLSWVRRHLQPERQTDYLARRSAAGIILQHSGKF